MDLDQKIAKLERVLKAVGDNECPNCAVTNLSKNLLQMHLTQAKARIAILEENELKNAARRNKGSTE